MSTFHLVTYCQWASVYYQSNDFLNARSSCNWFHLFPIFSFPFSPSLWVLPVRYLPFFVLLIHVLLAPALACFSFFALIIALIFYIISLYLYVSPAVLILQAHSQSSLPLLSGCPLPLPSFLSFSAARMS